MIPMPFGFFGKPTITPIELDNQLYWLDFTDDSTITTISGNISNVEDKFGNWDWGQSDITERPNYNTTASLNYMELNEGPHIRTDDVVVMPNTNKFTLNMVVTLYDETDGNNGILLEISDNNNNNDDSLVAILRNSDNQVVGTYKGSSGYKQVGLTPISPYYGETILLSMVYNKDEILASNSIKIYINGRLFNNILYINTTSDTKNWGDYVHYIGERLGDLVEIYADIYECWVTTDTQHPSEILEYYNNYVSPKYSI